MSITLAISIFGIVVAAVIALIVAYMQRKQMRQIEAFRVDPKVGLIPPPHPIRKFWNRNAAFIAMSVVPACGIVWDMSLHGPVTHGDVFLVATNVGMLVLAIVLKIVRILIPAFVDGYKGISYKDSKA